MQPRIVELAEKKLVGIHITTSLSNDKTFELWRTFMPRRNEITNGVTADLVSLQVYDPSFAFTQFNPDKSFDKWALKEVIDFNSVPDGMEKFLLPGGLYAVFLHHGSVAEAPKAFGYIWGKWIPESDYTVDNRPHFEVLGSKYKNDSPDSEEEIWIPIKPK